MAMRENMNQAQFKFGRNIYNKFSQLSIKEQFSIGFRILRLQAQILFFNRFYWFIAAIFGYFVIAYIINYKSDMINRLSQNDVLLALFMIPFAVLAILLNMQIISREKDNRTLEVMFTTSGSRYKVWILRVTTLNLILLSISIFFSTFVFFTFTEIEIIATGFHAFVPTFFIGSMTLYFAVKFRSGFAAGMLVGGFIMLHFMFTEVLEDTKYSLFFNPYDIPRRLDPETWSLWMWQNRITVLLLGCFLQFLALRGLENREKMLQ